MTDQEENHGLEQAKAQYSSICEMVAALEVDYDRLEELKDDLNGFLSDDSDSADRSIADWELNYPSDSEELSELLDAAGDCENREAARDRIQEDPLSVEVRSGWYRPGCEAPPPEEFQILLCTGGPAVRIMGELDEHGQPVRAWMEYQDWFRPWTQFLGAEQDILLTYCEQSYFGEG